MTQAIALYASKPAALARAKERSGAGEADDAYLNELLLLSAAVTASDAETLIYRPFYVAAKFLEQDLARQALTEDEGTKFTLLWKPIKSLLAQQRGIDKALGLIVPPGQEAIDLECQDCGDQGGGDRAIITRVRPMTLALHKQVYP